MGNGLSFANINARFVGAGPRVGIRGRRYFGACGLLSLYAKASQAVLIGDYRMDRTLNVPGQGSETPTQITNQFDLFHRTIPVTDIEVGGTRSFLPSSELLTARSGVFLFPARKYDYGFCLYRGIYLL